MTVGNIIEAEDYNRIRNKIIAVLGNGGTNPNTGSADPTFGYGQSLQSSVVALGQKVSKQQWDNLRWDIFNTRTHQTSAVPGIQEVTTNSKIQATVLDYEGFADSAISDRLNIGNNQFAIEPGTVRSRNFAWSVQATCTATVAFANANQARFFFNTGGQIRLSSSFTPNTTTAQHTSWQNLLIAVGTQTIDQSIFYNLTNTNVVIYTNSASGIYEDNNFQLRARCNVANNSGGTATQVIIQAVWTDGYTDPDLAFGRPTGAWVLPEDIVDGNLSLTLQQRRATTIIQPGTSPFVIASPTYSTTDITGT
jgi:hypothetical protein